MHTVSRETDLLAEAFERSSGRPLVSITEAARMTSLSRKWLWSEVRRGALKSYRLGGTGNFRIRCTDLAAWVTRVNP
jgi:excisionase family DNA binding protein